MEPRCNKVLGITNDFLYPSDSKLYGKVPRYNETSLQRRHFFSLLALLYIEVPPESQRFDSCWNNSDLFFQLKKTSFSPYSVVSLVQNQQREFTLRQAKEMEKDAKQRLAIQRQEYEAAIQRHLSFIDQLIDDKKVLSQRCEEVVNKLKSTDKKYGDKIKQMEEK